MDIAIAIVLEVSILLGLRWIIFGRIGIGFWLLLLALNAAALLVRPLIDAQMDAYGWDQIDPRGSDWLLDVAVFFGPAAIIGTALLVWPERWGRRPRHTP